MGLKPYWLQLIEEISRAVLPRSAAMADVDAATGRAVVIAVLGPIRAGKGLTAGLQGIAGLLHGDRIRKIVEDNPALLMQDFAAAQHLIGRIRGPRNLATLWPNLSPAARLNLCLDPWGNCRGLNLSSVGLEQWHPHWGHQGFQIIGQDSYLESQGQLPHAQLARDLRECKDMVNADLGMPRIILLEGFEWIMPQYNPTELLPLIDYMVVLHAPEELIKSRARHPSLFEREVLPMVKEFQRLFPSQRLPHEDVSREGIWQSVPNVDCLGLSCPNLQIAHFMGPGTKGEEILSRARLLGELILGYVATQVNGDYERTVWQVFPETNCFDGHGGANVNLQDDNAFPKNMSVEDAKRVCEGSGFAGFTNEPRQSRVWWLRSVHDPSRFIPSKRFEVHVLSDFQCYPATNCFDGYGGANVDLQGDNTHPKVMRVEDAKQFCRENGYAGFTYEPSQNRVWWLSSAHDPSRFNPSWGPRFEVYVRTSPNFSGL